MARRSQQDPDQPELWDDKSPKEHIEEARQVLRDIRDRKNAQHK